MNEILSTVPLSLFDSLSTTLQIIVFVLLLTTENPIRNAVAYLIGLAGVYFLCGFGGYYALDALREIISRMFPYKNVPNRVYYQSEFFSGLILTAIGLWTFFRKKRAPRNRLIQWLLTKLIHMNGLFAFCIGGFISLVSFPGSIPYFLALTQYSALHLAVPGVLAYILFYNLIYASPMLLILGLYLYFREDTREYHDSLHEHARRLNLHLTTWTFVGFGLFAMLDAALFFTVGQAMIKRYF